MSALHSRESEAGRVDAGLIDLVREAMQERPGTISIESARVYRAGGRRWFTKRAAAKALVRKALKSLCECEGPDPSQNYPGYTCFNHATSYEYEEIVDALTAELLASAPSPTVEEAK